MEKEILCKEWIKSNNPEPVTRIIFSGLVRFYDNGKPECIFRKMISLEQSESYNLCSQLFDLMKYIGIEKEFVNWKKNK